MIYSEKSNYSKYWMECFTSYNLHIHIYKYMYAYIQHWNINIKMSHFNVS